MKGRPRLSPGAAFLFFAAGFAKQDQSLGRWILAIELLSRR